MALFYANLLRYYSFSEDEMEKKRAVGLFYSLSILLPLWKGCIVWKGRNQAAQREQRLLIVQESFVTFLIGLQSHGLAVSM